MDAPLRVLVVEHGHADRSIAKQLFKDYEIDFNWRRVGSLLELRQVGSEFDPNIVLCSDDVSTDSSRSVLDALRLLCSQTPAILISSVHESDACAAPNAIAIFSKTTTQSRDGMPHQSVPEVASPHHAPDIAELRRCFSALLEASLVPAVMSNADGWITYANTSACRLLDESCERSLGTLLSGPIDQALHSSVATMPASTLPGVGVHRLAYFDAWTRHPTLIHTHDLIGCVTARTDVRRTAVALVALNLDSARIPDEKLPDREVAEVDVQSEVAKYGSILRIAPDDFLLVLSPLSGAGDAALVAHRIVESIAQARPAAGGRVPGLGAADMVPVSANGRSVESDASPPSASNHHASVHRPDRRPPQSAAEQPATTQDSRSGASLGDAIQRHALSVQYQPQFELHTGRGCGVEALARWTLSTGQIIAPSIFIPLAERVGMIHALGAWVLQSACETAYSWFSREAQRTTLSVNVSALQINEDFCAVIGRALRESRFPAKHLELEITESALIGNTERTIECLRQWKRLGVQIAVDDFGTGYSSLSYLSRLPVDRLKLDQSLIHRMTVDAKGKTVMRSVISLGADLGMDVIAEGVETEQQFQMLEDLGCPRVQGYLLGRPMPPKQAQLALRKVWGNRPNPVFRPRRNAVGESLVQ